MVSPQNEPGRASRVHALIKTTLAAAAALQLVKRQWPGASNGAPGHYNNFGYRGSWRAIKLPQAVL